MERAMEQAMEQATEQATERAMGLEVTETETAQGPETAGARAHRRVW